MKKLLPILGILLCLCACHKDKKIAATEIALSYKDVDYEITKLVKLENDENFIPVLSSCDSKYLYGMMQDSAEFVEAVTTNRLFHLENGKVANYPLNKQAYVSDQLMIQNKLFYIADINDDKGKALYQYNNGKNDLLIKRFHTDEVILVHHDSTFLVLAFNQNHIQISRYEKENLTQIAEINLEQDLNGVTIAGVRQNDLFIITIKDEIKTLQSYDLNTGKIKHQLENEAFDQFIITDQHIVLYNGKKESVYNHSLELQNVYQTPEAHMIGVTYSSENNNIGVLIDANRNIYLRTYKDETCYKIDAEADVLLQELMITSIQGQSLIATTADNEIYKIEFQINE